MGMKKKCPIEKNATVLEALPDRSIMLHNGNQNADEKIMK